MSGARIIIRQDHPAEGPCEAYTGWTETRDGETVTYRTLHVPDDSDALECAAEAAFTLDAALSPDAIAARRAHREKRLRAEAAI